MRSELQGDLCCRRQARSHRPALQQSHFCYLEIVVHINMRKSVFQVEYSPSTVEGTVDLSHTSFLSSPMRKSNTQERASIPLVTFPHCDRTPEQNLKEERWILAQFESSLVAKKKREERLAK